MFLNILMVMSLTIRDIFPKQSTRAVTVWNRSQLLADQLRYQVKGKVLTSQDKGYHEARIVRNAICDSDPLLILIPHHHWDVSTGVIFARIHRLEVSVRSGGHSYTCTSLKAGGLHIDMRAINKVQVIKRGRKGWALRLGPGSRWKRVLEIVPPTQFTFIHGQCRHVGVGGFLLGGGVNFLGSTNKFGWGAEHVLAATMVTAEGDIAMVEEKKTTITSRMGTNKKYVYHTEDTDLMFALRGAGSSFGIVTEFLYKMYKTPETRPVYLFVWIDSPKDLLNLQEAALHPNNRYNVVLAQSYYFVDTLELPFNLFNIAYDLMKKVHGRNVSPILLSMTDIGNGSGTHTPILPAIQYLEYFGVKVVLKNPALVHLFSAFCFEYHGHLLDYEHVYMLGRDAEVPQNVATANIAGIANISEVADIFLFDPHLGVMKGDRTLELNCDYCYWFFVFFVNSPQSRDRRISTNPEMLKRPSITTDLTCMFKNYKRDGRCPSHVAKIRERLGRTQNDLGRAVIQYANTPSCDSHHFGEKYWGVNFPKLLRIKNFWDPQNVFHHCQSVGSTDGNCCPPNN